MLTQPGQEVEEEDLFAAALALPALSVTIILSARAVPISPCSSD